MPNRTAREVAQEFLSALQLAVSCVTNHVLRAGGFDPAPGAARAVYLTDSPAPLRSRQSIGPRLALLVSHEYRVLSGGAEGARGVWTVHSTQYEYALRLQDGQKLLVYHWHPFSQSPITWPHTHLEAATGISFESLRTAHAPTGMIPLEDFLRFAKSDLEVRPLRENWEEILRRVRATVFAVSVAVQSGAGSAGA